MNIESLVDFLASSARGGGLPWDAELEAARRYRLGARELEAAALAAGILPARYARNAGAIGLAGQLALHRSSVAVAGCGGIGGYVVEELARLGVGTIVAVDPDSFEASNLNRQILATLDSLGEPKVEAAARRIRAVNPAVVARPVRARLDADNSDGILEGVDAVADGLDSIAARLEVAEACARLGIPFVHASVAGWYAQAATQEGSASALREVYRDAASERGAETLLGAPSFTPAVAAGIEVAELCKILIGFRSGLRGRLLRVDLLAMRSSERPI